MLLETVNGIVRREGKREREEVISLMAYALFWWDPRIISGGGHLS